MKDLRRTILEVANGKGKLETLEDAQQVVAAAFERFMAQQGCADGLRAGPTAAWASGAGASAGAAGAAACSRAGADLVRSEDSNHQRSQLKALQQVPGVQVANRPRRSTAGSSSRAGLKSSSDSHATHDSDSGQHSRSPVGNAAEPVDSKTTIMKPTAGAISARHSQGKEITLDELKAILGTVAPDSTVQVWMYDLNTMASLLEEQHAEQLEQQGKQQGEQHHGKVLFSEALLQAPAHMQKVLREFAASTVKERMGKFLQLLREPVVQPLLCGAQRMPLELHASLVKLVAEQADEVAAVGTSVMHALGFLPAANAATHAQTPQEPASVDEAGSAHSAQIASGADASRTGSSTRARAPAAAAEAVTAAASSTGPLLLRDIKDKLDATQLSSLRAIAKCLHPKADPYDVPVADILLHLSLLVKRDWEVVHGAQLNKAHRASKKSAARKRMAAIAAVLQHDRVKGCVEQLSGQQQVRIHCEAHFANQCFRDKCSLADLACAVYLDLLSATALPDVLAMAAALLSAQPLVLQEQQQPQQVGQKQQQQQGRLQQQVSEVQARPLVAEATGYVLSDKVHGPAHSPVSTHAPGSGASGQALELPLLRLGETPSMQHEVLDSAGMPELELEQGKPCRQRIRTFGAGGRGRRGRSVRNPAIRKAAATAEMAATDGAGAPWGKSHCAAASTAHVTPQAAKHSHQATAGVSAAMPETSIIVITDNDSDSDCTGARVQPMHASKPGNAMHNSMPEGDLRSGMLDQQQRQLQESPLDGHLPVSDTAQQATPPVTPQPGSSLQLQSGTPQQHTADKQQDAQQGKQQQQDVAQRTWRQDASQQQRPAAPASADVEAYTRPSSVQDTQGTAAAAGGSDGIVYAAAAAQAAAAKKTGLRQRKADDDASEAAALQLRVKRRRNSPQQIHPVASTAVDTAANPSPQPLSVFSHGMKMPDFSTAGCRGSGASHAAPAAAPAAAVGAGPMDVQVASGSAPRPSSMPVAKALPAALRASTARNTDGGGSSKEGSNGYKTANAALEGLGDGASCLIAPAATLAGQEAATALRDHTAAVGANTAAALNMHNKSTESSSGGDSIDGWHSIAGCSSGSRGDVSRGGSGVGSDRCNGGVQLQSTASADGAAAAAPEASPGKAAGTKMQQLDAAVFPRQGRVKNGSDGPKDAPVQPVVAAGVNLVPTGNRAAEATAATARGLAAAGAGASSGGNRHTPPTTLRAQGSRQDRRLMSPRSEVSADRRPVHAPPEQQLQQLSAQQRRQQEQQQQQQQDSGQPHEHNGTQPYAAAAAPKVRVATRVTAASTDGGMNARMSSSAMCVAGPSGVASTPPPAAAAVAAAQQGMAAGLAISPRVAETAIATVGGPSSAMVPAGVLTTEHAVNELWEQQRATMGLYQTMAETNAPLLPVILAYIEQQTLMLRGVTGSQVIGMQLAQLVGAKEEEANQQVS